MPKRPTYANLLPIAHWQTVCADRYPNAKRVTGFTGWLEILLAGMLDLTEERVKKLRITLRGLRTGRFSSLHGMR